MSAGAMRRAVRGATLGFALAGLLGTTSADAKAPVAVEVALSDSTWRTQGVVAANGTTIHFVDYGGRGPALVFLAGLGNSAHVFDDFAPRFTDRRHVIAITRRGYGASGRPKGGYDTGTLVEDIHAVLDSLHVDRAAFAGHSVAGDELTEFAARYPARTEALAYLDAAYDRSHTGRRLLGMAVLGQLPPAPPGPTGSDRADLASARAYLERIYGVRWPAAEIAATRQFDGSGRWFRDATPGSTNMKIMQGEIAPRYADVHAPVLAIYTTERGDAQDFPWIERMFIGRGVAQLKATRFERAEARFEQGERRRLAEALPAARIVEFRGASHYVFISNADEVEREMRGLLQDVR